LTGNTVKNALNVTVFNENFTYDTGSGSMTSKNGLSFTYDASLKNVVASYNGNSFSYDADGNQTTRTLASAMFQLVYNAENHLVQVNSDHSFTDETVNWYGVIPTATITATATMTSTVTQTATITSTATLTSTPTATATAIPPNGIARYYYDGNGTMVKSVIDDTATYYPSSVYRVVVTNGSQTSVRKYYGFGGSDVAMSENATVIWLLQDQVNSTTITANAPKGVLRDRWQFCF
jgi:hypothetical protein